MVQAKSPPGMRDPGGLFLAFWLPLSFSDSHYPREARLGDLDTLAASGGVVEYHHAICHYHSLKSDSLLAKITQADDVAST